MNRENTQIRQEANAKLEAAGAYGRTIDRWWAGFYHGGIKPTEQQTIDLSVDDILRIIVCGSRRG